MFIRFRNEREGYKAYPNGEDKIRAILGNNKKEIECNPLLYDKSFVCGWVAHLIEVEGINSNKLNELHIDIHIRMRAMVILEQKRNQCNQNDKN